MRFVQQWNTEQTISLTQEANRKLLLNVRALEQTEMLELLKKIDTSRLKSLSCKAVWGTSVLNLMVIQATCSRFWNSWSSRARETKLIAGEKRMKTGRVITRLCRLRIEKGWTSTSMSLLYWNRIQNMPQLNREMLRILKSKRRRLYSYQTRLLLSEI